MAANIFLDRTPRPNPAKLARAVGHPFRYWEELKRHVRAPVTEEWKYYGKTIGWTLKLLRGKRNLCFMTACDGYFALSFVLGERAVAEARRSRLPANLVQELVNARKYVEGRGIRIDIKSRRAIEHAKILIDIKLERLRTR